MKPISLLPKITEECIPEKALVKKKYVLLNCYSQQNQKFTQELKKKLEESGIPTRILPGNIHSGENILIETISDTRVFVACLSESYKRSNSCRAALQLALRLHKDIIYIRTEDNDSLRADGWLWAIKDIRINYDISAGDTEHVKKDLVEEIQGRFVSQRMQKLNRWTADNVKLWLSRENLYYLKPKSINPYFLLVLVS